MFELAKTCPYLPTLISIVQNPCQVRCRQIVLNLPKQAPCCLYSFIQTWKQTVPLKGINSEFRTKQS